VAAHREVFRIVEAAHFEPVLEFMQLALGRVEAHGVGGGRGGPRQIDGRGTL
jgi:hypothetical protein